MRVSRKRQIGAMAVFLIAVGILWRQVFAMTGILWWQEAPRLAERPAPPPAAQFRELPTGWIDLPAYQRTHDKWPLDRP